MKPKESRSNDIFVRVEGWVLGFHAKKVLVENLRTIFNTFSLSSTHLDSSMIKNQITWVKMEISSSNSTL